MSTAWYNYDVYSDYPDTSYHNTDVGTPVDTALTAPLAGKVSDVTYQDWGGQVTIQADDPGQIGGYPYYFLIHLDSINPALRQGAHVAQGGFLGYSGGQYPGQFSSLPALPAGYTHHDTQASHSTGPHLDIGVTSYPQGSMDESKAQSDQLVTIARKGHINADATGGGSVAVSNAATKQDWAYMLLAALGNPNPDQAQVEFVSAWEHAESGQSGGAQNNPLNTEEPNTPGVVSDFNPVGVKNYDTFAHGIQAEAKVLNNGRYDPLLQALQTPGAASDAALGIPGGQPSAGVIASLNTWGTSDWPTIFDNLSAGSEAINTSGAPPSDLCSSCQSLPPNARPVFCAVCGAAATTTSTVTNAAGSLLPSWLTTPPWLNKDLLGALARAGFIVLGGGLILVGGILAVHETGEATGINQAVHQAQGKVLQLGSEAAGVPTTIGGALRGQREERETRKRQDITRANKAIAGAEAHKKAISKAQAKKAA